MQWQAEAPARRLAQQPLHVRGYAYAMQVQAYQAYQVQLAKYQAENYAFARAGTTREAEALRIYNEKLAIHHRWVAEQAGIEHERAQLLFYDTVTATAKTLSDPSTAIHLTLDVLGMIPVIGEPADGLNALIYLAEGDEVNAAISAAGMIPIGGMAVTGARAVKTAVKTGLHAAEQIAATSLSMLKVTPPAPTAVLKTNTSAATMPTAPVGAATPPAPKQIEAAPVRLQIEAATPAKLDELAAGKELQPYYPPNNGFAGVPEQVVIEPGALLGRRGEDTGHFFTEAGAPEYQLALPYDAKGSLENVYRVNSPFVADAGTIAPAFGDVGGGVQFVTTPSAGQLVEWGFLEPLIN